MADAGLTNGAFYAHIASKDDLVATLSPMNCARRRRGTTRSGPADRDSRTSFAVCRSR
ncbi:hypothetical protein SNL152K_1232 [Streptomyces sp. NL15-2K]|nr:hypothetical protein SNL152K_1232 [Streptomyces sp. NL15-2K]